MNKYYAPLFFFSLLLVVALGVGIFFAVKNYKRNLLYGRSYPYSLPTLAYNYNALEPYIDAETMEIHYSKHHQKYVDELNEALKNYPDLQSKSLQELLTHLDRVPQAIRDAVRNNGGGHFNHSIFWNIMTPDAQKKELPEGKLKADIIKAFGSIEEFKKQFSEKAKKLFGSGWVWLVLDNGKLSIVTTKDQDSPVSRGLIPFLGLDVWEHAYYLKYHNKRADYIDAWWNTVNWHALDDHYFLGEIPY